MTFCLHLSVIGLLVLTYIRFSFPSGVYEKYGNLCLRCLQAGPYALFQPTKYISRSEIVTPGLGHVRAGVPYPCSFFPEKYLLKQWPRNGGNLNLQLQDERESLMTHVDLGVRDKKLLLCYATEILEFITVAQPTIA